MISWTQLIEGHKEYYTSLISTAKVYVLDRNNPLSTEVFVKQVPCTTGAEVTKVVNLGRISECYPHSNLCRTLQVAIEPNPAGGNFVYIVTQYVGNNLADEIKQRTKARVLYFTEIYLKQMLVQLVSAYAFLQEKTISHRDIKPANILLDEKGNPKICDFGCAKEGFDGVTDATFLGAAMYFSPLLRNAVISGVKRYERVTHNPFKSDVYALGMTLLQASCLQYPSKLMSSHKLQENINEELQKLTQYSEEWKSMIKLMLTIEEEPRLDFVQLRRTIDPGFAPPLPLPYPVFPFADDELINAPVPDIIAEDGDPLQISTVCGYSQVPISQYMYQLTPCMVTLQVPEGTGGRTYGVDVVWVIDCSYSMTAERTGIATQRLRPG